MSKKILSLFAAACVLISAGCSDSKPQTAAETASDTTSTSAAETAADTESPEEEEEEAEETEESDDKGDNETETGSDEEESEQSSVNDGDDEYLMNPDFDEDELLNDLEMNDLGIHTSGTTGYPYDGTLGTARELDGNIAVVSAFLSTPGCPWDFDELFYTEAFAAYWVGLDEAVKFIETKSNEYGHSPHFIYDWNEHPELIYKGTVDTDPMDHSGINTADEYIDSYVYTADILESTGADQIIYMIIYNTPAYNHTTSYTKIVTGTGEDLYPYEMCNMLMNVDDRENTMPSTIAHEMLHAFGAPDLYSTQGISSFYGITQEFVDYLRQNNINDIMRVDADFDPSKGEPDYDGVWQEMTEITAYYVGLTDHSETVEQWGFAPSQHSYR